MPHPQQTLLEITPAAAPTRATADMMLCFDGGCVGTRRFAYGSYAFLIADRMVERVRLEFGEHLTSNVAEWQTLAVALERLPLFCDANTTNVLVRGDSMIVIEGAARRWKVKAPHLRPLAQRVWKASALFPTITFEWWRRNNSVAVLGH